ncbi:MAG: SDR family oxidoreductase [Treponema sp.]|jgi:NAD(P)-dependent dehydrogenase (short-subunit alcohol dehydrogenase family)|nr:SDR family oxidoreductase [Treponema sp.]
MTEKVALVTGAGSGLGRGLARVLINSGYHIGIHTGSNEERARILAAELAKESGRRAEVLVSDFSKPGGAEKLFESFRKTYDRLDIFVNNAGVTMGTRILNMTEELWDTINNINWRNAFFCVKEAAKLMIEREIHGTMVLISSNQHNSIGGNVPYALVKDSLVKLTQHAAMQFARHGIRVNCIAPGWVNTGEKRMEGWFERSVNEIPLHRWVEPEEIGRWVLFLDGPDAASLTGQTIELDGGVRLMTGRPEYYCSPEV